MASQQTEPVGLFSEKPTPRFVASTYMRVTLQMQSTGITRKLSISEASERAFVPITLGPLVQRSPSLTDPATAVQESREFPEEAAQNLHRQPER